ncbi:DUF4238 domain-containing protein [Myxococcus sp. AM010]|uniref:DUF4238 domain-containing protein n=1 Tax=Myxococcus sp. AM010 TaxID=2745138 RepID=UPI001595F398|nr:DUF4238 domain-containing protein [Myxococcus sp. AM010]NVJ14231.1 DUF4238 domain-containing protein [Myxococcus sp. AM010]
MAEKIRKQHYVWEHYLTGWAVGGKVWCQRGKNRFQTSTENIAQRRDFYRLREMSERDVLLVNQYIDQMAPHLQEMARGWIPVFTDLFEIRKLYRATGQQDAELEKELDVAINNTEEDLHSSIENAAVPILAALRQGDFSILDDQESYVDFASYMAAQHLRTYAMEARMLQNAKMLVQLGANMEAIWGILRTISVTSAGFHFFSEHDSTRLTILNASPSSEFITGDQPMLNLLSDGVTPPAKLELYYPLAPSRALLMDFGHSKATRESRALSIEEVQIYNRRIAKSSEGQVYASSEAALSALTL